MRIAGMRPIGLPSPAGCGSEQGVESAWLVRIPDSQAIPPRLSGEDDGWDAEGETGPESGTAQSLSLLPPLCLDQSRISPEPPVG